jgi:predicted O-methyltransferase YrrM
LPDDPYASHLPVLRLVLALAKPKRVLELGAGEYSTPEFLDCPSLTYLRSIETDPTWAKRVDTTIDGKWFELDVTEDTVEALPRDLTTYDLIFIDNGHDPGERNRTIRAVLERDHPVTVIHDAEVYGGVINELAENRMIFDNLTPHTAVVW